VCAFVRVCVRVCSCVGVCVRLFVSMFRVGVLHVRVHRVHAAALVERAAAAGVGWRVGGVAEEGRPFRTARSTDHRAEELCGKAVDELAHRVAGVVLRSCEEPLPDALRVDGVGDDLDQGAVLVGLLFLSRAHVPALFAPGPPWWGVNDPSAAAAPRAGGRLAVKVGAVACAHRGAWQRKRYAQE